MNSITEYFMFRIKVRQSIFLQLACTYHTVSNNPETSIACFYSLFLPQHCAIFIDGFIHRVFIKSFATQPSFSRRFIKAAISFRTKSNHLSTSKFFLEKSRCPLILFPMLLKTVSGEEIVVFNGSKVTSTVVLSIRLPHRTVEKNCKTVVAL